MYRVGQFFRAMGARVDDRELDALDGYLTPAQRALFCRMSPSDQRHALDVYHALRRKGYTEQALLQAALLHDVGKAHESLRLWHRVLVVLIQTIAPRLLARLARPEPGTWRYPFFVHLHHPAWGAELAQAAGSDPLAVALIRHHQDPVPAAWRERPEGRLLAALQETDGDH